MLGSILSAGTHFHLALGDESYMIVDEAEVLRTNPQETMKKITAFFKENPPDAIGIGSFGPIDIDIKSDKYGFITSTPKFGWEYYNFLGELKKHFDIPMGWNTNANASALGEYYLHSSDDIKSLLYLTFGTGVGGGFIYQGRIFRGSSHPEMGHILVEKLLEDDFSSRCPYHENCLEGRVSRASIQERTGKNFEDLSDDDPIFEMVGNYIAQALVDVTMVLRPDRIVLGGNTMEKTSLLKITKKYFEKYFNHYIQIPPLDDYICCWDPEEKPGIIGGFLLAQRALKHSANK